MTIDFSNMIFSGAVQRLAECFLETVRRCGLTCSEPVLVAAHSQPQIVASWLACLDLSIVPVLVHGNQPASTIEGIQQAAGARYFFEFTADNRLKEKVLSSSTKRSVPPVWSAPCGSVVHITSATSGAPKLVLRTANQLTAELDRYLGRMKMSQRDIIISTAPLYHSFGFVCAFLAAQRSGASIVDPGVILPKKVIQRCTDEGVTMMFGAPFVFAKLVEASRGCDLSKIMNLRCCYSSGGPMPKGLQEEFQSTFGVPLLQLYGSTETGVLSASEVGDPHTCVGRPLHGVSFSTEIDNKGLGWLRVSSPRTIGYYVTACGLQELPPGNYRNGDIGEVDSRGRLHLLGRGDDIEIIAGKKLSLRRIEGVIKRFPGIGDVRCRMRHFRNRGEVEVVYRSATELDVNALSTYCSQYLADFERPRHFIAASTVEEMGHHSWKIEQ